MESLHECFIDIFAVYNPGMQGVPRKYLVRDDVIMFLEHSDLRPVINLPEVEKEAIWFSALRLLGQDYIKNKLGIFKPQKKVSKGKYHSILELEKAASHKKHTQLLLIEEETKGIDSEFAKDALLKTSKAQCDMRILQEDLSALYTGRKWEISTIDINQPFPRIVFTDLSKVFVLSSQSHNTPCGLTGKGSSLFPCLAASALLMKKLNACYQTLSSEKTYGKVLRDLLVNISYGNSEFAAKDHSTLTEAIDIDTDNLVEFLGMLVDEFRNEEKGEQIMDLFSGSKVVSVRYNCGTLLEYTDKFRFMHSPQHPQETINGLFENTSNSREVCPKHNRSETCSKIIQRFKLPSLLVVHCPDSNSVVLNLKAHEIVYKGSTYKMVAVLVYDKILKTAVSVCRMNQVWTLFNGHLVSAYLQSSVVSPWIIFFEISS